MGLPNVRKIARVREGSKACWDYTPIRTYKSWFVVCAMNMMQ